MPIDEVIVEVQSPFHRSGTERSKTEKQPEASANGGTSEEDRDHRSGGRVFTVRSGGGAQANLNERPATVVGGTPRTSGI